jgi:hypothetical protein
MKLHRLAQHVDIGSLLGELGKRHRGVDHRGSLLDKGWWVAPQPYPAS